MENKAIEFFIEHTKYKKEDILHLKQIHHGFTNLSYLLVTTDNKKYQVRFGGSNDVVSRKNEYAILKAIKEENYLYIDEEGNAIKKWIEGKPPVFFWNKKKKLKLLVEQIIKMHSIKFNDSNLIKHDYLFFFNKAIFQNNLDKELYLKLIDKYKNLELILSHNDLNPKNMIYDSKKSKMYLIDFEWGRINNKYWDIANFYRETNLSTKWLKYMVDLYKGLDFQTMCEFVYITTNFAYQWTFGMKETKKILNYRKYVSHKMNKYRKFVE
ncbi:choline kinase [Malacoplasma muris]|uniref:OspG family effector kinase n=1 Tax=Malacoplasma muris TaxID=2119 RepID=UPI00398F5E77